MAHPNHWYPMMFDCLQWFLVRLPSRGDGRGLISMKSPKSPVHECSLLLLPSDACLPNDLGRLYGTLKVSRSPPVTRACLVLQPIPLTTLHKWAPPTSDDHRARGPQVANQWKKFPRGARRATPAQETQEGEKTPITCPTPLRLQQCFG